MGLPSFLLNEKSKPESSGEERLLRGERACSRTPDTAKKTGQWQLEPVDEHVGAGQGRLEEACPCKEGIRAGQQPGKGRRVAGTVEPQAGRVCSFS